MTYSTKQQQAVLHCLETRREDTLTANDLAEDLRRSGSPVGLATIYRQLLRPYHSLELRSSAKPAGASGAKPSFPH